MMYIGRSSFGSSIGLIMPLGFWLGLGLGMGLGLGLGLG